MLLPGKLEGIGWFTNEIFRRIVQAHPEVEFHFFFDRSFSQDFVFGENVVAHVVPPQARRPFLMRIWYDVSWPYFLKKVKPDLVISPDAQCSLKTLFPQIVVIHDINFEHYPQDIPAVYTRDLKKRTPKFCEKARRIVTVSEFSKNDIAKQFAISAEKIDVVYNAANSIYTVLNETEKNGVKARIAGGEDYFIFVGSIHPRKNLQRLLPAFIQFKNATGSPMKLVIVGNTFWKNKELASVMESTEHRDDIIFIGRLDVKELSKVVGAALASVYVSYFEGFGIPVVEAFRAGVPVITSNVTSLPEVAGDAAIQVDPFSIDAIAKALEQVANDSGLRQSLIEKGLKRAQSFDWDESAKKFWTIIERTIQDVRSHSSRK
jgi:glycosyltransferase involved in cell wall biosynthesis